MIGIYDYTVILTYLSLISAGCGIVISLSGRGHPYIGVFFLMFSGLCDAFDGKVAGTKKNRTQEERSFGIQIDSLSDLVAFGVLPACIGSAMLRVSPIIQAIGELYGDTWKTVVKIALSAILVVYILAAMIRLAYYNVTEEQRQKTESGGRMYFTGLPVTTSALIFPFILLLQYIIPADITLSYFAAVLFTGIAFLSRVEIIKPGIKGILIMVGIGAVEFLFMLISRIIKYQ